MDQSLLVFILSVLVFVFGAVFINYTVKKEEAKQKREKTTAAASAEPSAKSA